MTGDWVTVEVNCFLGSVGLAVDGATGLWLIRLRSESMDNNQLRWIRYRSISDRLCSDRWA